MKNFLKILKRRMLSKLFIWKSLDLVINKSQIKPERDTEVLYIKTQNISRCSPAEVTVRP